MLKKFVWSLILVVIYMSIFPVYAMATSEYPAGSVSAWLESEEREQGIGYYRYLLQQDTERRKEETSKELGVVDQTTENFEYDSSESEEDISQLIVYVIKSGANYHYRTCRCVAQGTIYEMTVSQAAYEGYEPCNLCKTPEYTAIETRENSHQHVATSDELTEFLNTTRNNDSKLYIMLLVLVCIILTTGICIFCRIRRCRIKSKYYAHSFTDAEISFIDSYLDTGFSFKEVYRDFNKEFKTKFSYSELATAYIKAMRNKDGLCTSKPKISALLDKPKVKVRVKVTRSKPLSNNMSSCISSADSSTNSDFDTSVNKTMKCPNCQVEIKDNVEQCPNCFCTFPEIYDALEIRKLERKSLTGKKTRAWLIACLAPVLLIAIINNAGLLLGFLPTVLIYGISFGIAKYFSSKVNEELAELPIPIPFEQNSDIESAPEEDSPVVQKSEPELAVPFVYAEPEIIDENKWQCPECHATMAPREKCWRCGIIFKQ